MQKCNLSCSVNFTKRRMGYQISVSLLLYGSFFPTYKLTLDKDRQAKDQISMLPSQDYLSVMFEGNDEATTSSGQKQYIFIKNHSNGHCYILCTQDMKSYYVFNIDAQTEFCYFPECELDEDNEERIEIYYFQYLLISGNMAKTMR